MHHIFSLTKGYESDTKLQPTGATETGWEDPLHQPKGQQIRESQEGYIQEIDQPGLCTFLSANFTLLRVIY